MVKNFISAADARQLTVTSDKLLNQAFKIIKEAATYGNCTVNFGVYETADTVITKITTALIEAGYTVELQTDDETDKPMALIITW